MKTNSSLRKFIANELSTEECKSIKAGWDANNPKNTTTTTTQNGSGGSPTTIKCYYFDGELLYCEDTKTGEILTSGY